VFQFCVLIFFETHAIHKSSITLIFKLYQFRYNVVLSKKKWAVRFSGWSGNKKETLDRHSSQKK